MQAHVGVRIVERMREVDTDDADWGTPARADPDAALQVRPRRIVGVAGIEEYRRAVVPDDSHLELGAADEQVAPPDARALGVARTEILITVAAHAAVSAGEEPLRRRQARELVGTDRSVLAAQQDAHSLAERAHDVAAQTHASKRRPRAERVAAAAHVHGP